MAKEAYFVKPVVQSYNLVLINLEKTALKIKTLFLKLSPFSTQQFSLNLHNNYKI